MSQTTSIAALGSRTSSAKTSIPVTTAAGLAKYAKDSLKAKEWLRAARSSLSDRTSALPVVVGRLHPSVFESLVKKHSFPLPSGFPVPTPTDTVEEVKSDVERQNDIELSLLDLIVENVRLKSALESIGARLPGVPGVPVLDDNYSLVTPETIRRVERENVELRLALKQHEEQQNINDAALHSIELDLSKKYEECDKLISENSVLNGKLKKTQETQNEELLNKCQLLSVENEELRQENMTTGHSRRELLAKCDSLSNENRSLRIKVQGYDDDQLELQNLKSQLSSLRDVNTNLKEEHEKLKALYEEEVCRTQDLSIREKESLERCDGMSRQIRLLTDELLQLRQSASIIGTEPVLENDDVLFWKAIAEQRGVELAALKGTLKYLQSNSCNTPLSSPVILGKGDIVDELCDLIHNLTSDFDRVINGNTSQIEEAGAEVLVGKSDGLQKIFQMSSTLRESILDSEDDSNDDEE